MIYVTQPPFSCFNVDIRIATMEEKRKPIFCKAGHSHIVFHSPHDEGLIIQSNERYTYEKLRF